MSATHAVSVWRTPAIWGNLATIALLVLIAAALFSLQSGDWWPATPLPDRWAGAGTTLAAYVAFCGVLLWRSRERKPVDDVLVSGRSQGGFVLVVHASQTGFARQLAERSAESLRSSGLAVKLRAIGDVNGNLLATSERALFVASTTGEGDPPDPALAFVRSVMSQPLALQHLRYAVLALGDHEYEHFCAFGHQLDDWLRRHGAQPLFDLVEVDNTDESALRHWQHHLGQIGGVTDLPDWAPAVYQSWTLQERRELNPRSLGGGAFHLAIAPPAGSSVTWVAGDIAEIGPRHAPSVVASLLGAAAIPLDARVAVAGETQLLSELAERSHLPNSDEIQGLDAQQLAEMLKPLPHREYSIASLPADGSLDILLRRMLKPDGTPGLGSGWLCDYAAIGGNIALRLRSNPNFHAPDPSRPLILVGNGTGIAGLRSHLKQRIAIGARRNWLLFGERNVDRDFFYGEEIRQWQAQGWLERVDLAFSRDSAQRVYVQQKIRDEAGNLVQWIADGAAIYVCGSLAGMAPGVDAALRQVLGDDQVEKMLAEGRYRRDVY